MKTNRLRNIIALLTLTVYVITSHSTPVVFASTQTSGASQPAKEILNPETFKIPAEMGIIHDLYKGSRPGTVILIQDAHAVPDAQRSIRALIDDLQKHYAIQGVALEGAASKLDPQLFRSFPDKKKLDTVFQNYLQAGELSGASTAAVLNDQSAEFYGVEDWNLYQKGIGFFLEAMAKEEELREMLSVKREAIEEEKEKNYPKELLELDRSIEDFYRKKINFPQLLGKLSAVQMPTPGSELALLAGELTEETDSTIELEIKRVAGQIKPLINPENRPEFNRQSQAYQTGQLSAAAFAAYLKKTAHTLSHPVLFSEKISKLIAKQQRLEDIQGTKLFNELETHIHTIKEMLFENDAQRELDRQSEELRLLTKLARLELSWDEWQLLRNGDKGTGRLDAFEHRFENHKKFYEIAEARDYAFFENLKKNQFSILVAGGFHTQGLTQFLKEAGISYVLITPQINEIPEITHYRDVMRGDVSWKNYFKAEEGRINLYDAFVRGTRDRLLADSVERRAFKLKLWRDQLIRDLVGQKRITELKKYARFLDEVNGKGLRTEDSGLSAQLIKKAERFIDNLRELKAAGQLSEANILKLVQPATTQAWPSIGLAHDRISEAVLIAAQKGDRTEVLSPSGKSELRFEELVAEGRARMEAGQYAQARELFTKAVTAYLETMQQVFGREIADQLSNPFILKKWIEKTGTGDVFEQRNIKDLDSEIRSKARLERVLLMSLLLEADYFRRSYQGPEVLTPRVYGPISETDDLRAEQLVRIDRVTLPGGRPTASDAYEFEHKTTRQKYIVKFMGARNWVELLGLWWFKRLGFSTVDLRIMKINGSPAVVMKKIDHVETFYDYGMNQLVNPELFSTRIAVERLLPASYSRLFKDSKLADIVIELKDAHLRNILLRVDEQGELLTNEPPIFIDKERSFGYRTNPQTGEGLSYQSYRGGRFAEGQINSGRETQELWGGEPLFHRSTTSTDLQGIAKTIVTVTPEELKAAIDGIRLQFPDELNVPAALRPESLSRTWADAIATVARIYGLPYERTELRTSAVSGVVRPELRWTEEEITAGKPWLEHPALSEEGYLKDRPAMLGFLYSIFRDDEEDAFFKHQLSAEIGHTKTREQLGLPKQGVPDQQALDQIVAELNSVWSRDGLELVHGPLAYWLVQMVKTRDALKLLRLEAKLRELNQPLEVLFYDILRTAAHIAHFAPNYGQGPHGEHLPGDQPGDPVRYFDNEYLLDHLDLFIAYLIEERENLIWQQADFYGGPKGMSLWQLYLWALARAVNPVIYNEKHFEEMVDRFKGLKEPVSGRTISAHEIQNLFLEISDLLPRIEADFHLLPPWATPSIYQMYAELFVDSPELDVAQVKDYVRVQEHAVYQGAYSEEDIENAFLGLFGVRDAELMHNVQVMTLSDEKEYREKLQWFIDQFESSVRPQQAELRLSPQDLTEIGRQAAITAFAQAVNEQFTLRERMTPEAMQANVLELREAPQRVWVDMIRDGRIPVETARNLLLVLDPQEITRAQYLLSHVLNLMKINKDPARRDFMDKLFARHRSENESAAGIYEIKAAEHLLLPGMRPFRAFHGLVRMVPQALVKNRIKADDDARVLAIFPASDLKGDDETILQYLHVFDSLAFATFYEREANGRKALIVSHIQSDRYNLFPQDVKKQYRDWRWQIRAALEHYAYEHKIELILSPDFELMGKRWPGMNETARHILYDIDMDANGYPEKTFGKPVYWEHGLSSSTWRVKEIVSGQQYGENFSAIFEPVGASRVQQVLDLIQSAEQKIRLPQTSFIKNNLMKSIQIIKTVPVLADAEEAADSLQNVIFALQGYPGPIPIPPDVIASLESALAAIREAVAERKKMTESPEVLTQLVWDQLERLGTLIGILYAKKRKEGRLPLSILFKGRPATSKSRIIGFLQQALEDLGLSSVYEEQIEMQKAGRFPIVWSDFAGQHAGKDVMIYEGVDRFPGFNQRPDLVVRTFVTNDALRIHRAIVRNKYPNVSELIVEEQARIQEGDIPFEPDLEMNTTDPAGTVVYRQDAVITMLRTSIQNGLRTELRNENRRDAIERIQLSDRDVWVRRFSLKEEPAAVIAEMENLRRQTEAQLPKQPHAQVPFNDLEHFLFVVRDAKELVGINTENASAGDHAWVIYDSEEGGQPIGFLHLSKNSEEAQDVNSAQYEIAVHPARRREGIAADLIEHVLLFLQQSPDAGIQIFSGDIHPENFASVTALYHAAENAGLDLYVRRDRPKEAWVFLVPLSGEPVLNAELFDYDAYAEVYRPEMRGFSNNIRRYIPYGNRSEDLSPSVIEAAIQQAREVAGRAVIARPYQMDIAEFLEQGNQRMNLVTPHVQGPVQLIAVRAHANVNPDQIFYIEIHDDLEEVLTAVGNYLSQAYPDNAFDLELGVSSAPAGYQDTLMMTVHSNDGIPAEVISPVSSMNPVFSQSPLESPVIHNNVRDLGPADNRTLAVRKFKSGRTEMRRRNWLVVSAAGLLALVVGPDFLSLERGIEETSPITTPNTDALVRHSAVEETASVTAEGYVQVAQTGDVSKVIRFIERYLHSTAREFNPAVEAIRKKATPHFASYFTLNVEGVSSPEPGKMDEVSLSRFEDLKRELTDYDGYWIRPAGVETPVSDKPLESSQRILNQITEIDQAGYERVAKTGDVHAVAVFVKRVAESLGDEITDHDHLTWFSRWYTEPHSLKNPLQGKALQSLERLEAELNMYAANGSEWIRPRAEALVEKLRKSQGPKAELRNVLDKWIQKSLARLLNQRDAVRPRVTSPEPVVVDVSSLEKMVADWNVLIAQRKEKTEPDIEKKNRQVKKYLRELSLVFNETAEAAVRQRILDFLMIALFDEDFVARRTVVEILMNPNSALGQNHLRVNPEDESGYFNFLYQHLQEPWQLYDYAPPHLDRAKAMRNKRLSLLAYFASDAGGLYGSNDRLLDWIRQKIDGYTQDPSILERMELLIREQNVDFDLFKEERPLDFLEIWVYAFLQLGMNYAALPWDTDGGQQFPYQFLLITMMRTMQQLIDSAQQPEFYEDLWFDMMNRTGEKLKAISDDRPWSLYNQFLERLKQVSADQHIFESYRTVAGRLLDVHSELRTEPLDTSSLEKMVADWNDVARQISIRTEKEIEVRPEIEVHNAPLKEYLHQAGVAYNQADDPGVKQRILDFLMIVLFDENYIARRTAIEILMTQVGMVDAPFHLRIAPDQQTDYFEFLYQHLREPWRLSEYAAPDQDRARALRNKRMALISYFASETGGIHNTNDDLLQWLKEKLSSYEEDQSVRERVAPFVEDNLNLGLLGEEQVFDFLDLWFYVFVQLAMHYGQTSWTDLHTRNHYHFLFLTMMATMRNLTQVQSFGKHSVAAPPVYQQLWMDMLNMTAEKLKSFSGTGADSAYEAFRSRIAQEAGEVRGSPTPLQAVAIRWLTEHSELRILAESAAGQFVEMYGDRTSVLSQAQLSGFISDTYRGAGQDLESFAQIFIESIREAADVNDGDRALALSPFDQTYVNDLTQSIQTIADWVSRKYPDRGAVFAADIEESDPVSAENVARIHYEAVSKMVGLIDAMVTTGPAAEILRRKLIEAGIQNTTRMKRLSRYNPVTHDFFTLLKPQRGVFQERIVAPHFSTGMDEHDFDSNSANAQYEQVFALFMQYVLGIVAGQVLSVEDIAVLNQLESAEMSPAERSHFEKEAVRIRGVLIRELEEIPGMSRIVSGLENGSADIVMTQIRNAVEEFKYARQTMTAA